MIPKTSEYVGLAHQYTSASISKADKKESAKSNEVSQSNVARIKEQIENGTYSLNMQAVAKKMSEELF
jgi:flagellar biosynthesis anti-sigma factor FlgM